MSRLLEIRDYLTGMLTFEWKPPWELVDGTQDRLNLIHECTDRSPADATALRIQHADDRRQTHTFGTLAAARSPTGSTGWA